MFHSQATIGFLLMPFSPLDDTVFLDTADFIEEDEHLASESFS